MVSECVSESSHVGTTSLNFGFTNLLRFLFLELAPQQHHVCLPPILLLLLLYFLLCFVLLVILLL